MESRNTSPVIKLLPSLADFAFLMPIVLLFTRLGGTKILLGDGDTGWHLRTGEWILANGRVPLEDIFSYTRPGQPWFAWEWLWDVVFAALYRAGGLALIVLVNIFLIAGIFFLLYKVISNYGNPVIALGISMTAAFASSMHWLARPHLFTLLFTIVFFWMLERIREGRPRLLWVLPALTVLWTNLHGGFFVGVILIGGYAAGEMITAVLTPDAGTRSGAWREARRYLVSAAACMAASLLNPYTYRLHTHIFEYLTDSFQREHIAEFLSLNFSHPVAPFFEFLLLAGALSAVWHASRGNYRAAVLTAVWAHGALLSARNIPIFAIVSAPFITAGLSHGLERVPELPVAGWIRRLAAAVWRGTSELGEMERFGRLHLVSAAAMVLVGALLFAPAPPKRFQPEYDPKAYPAAALKAMNPGADARIFANDEWGDYLIFKLYPRGIRVFVDGRSDFYGRDFEEKFLDTYMVKHDWEQTLRKYAVNTVLLPADAPLAGAMKESSRWRVVYDDGMALVFRPSSVNFAPAPRYSAAPGGSGRDREITKTETRDPLITNDSIKSKT